LVALDQLAPVFDLTATEDAVVGGLTITARGQKILLIPGQNFAQVNGRVVSLSASIARDRNGVYQVPIDFVSVALARALNTRIEVRKTSHLIIVGDISVPHVTIKVDKQATGARVSLEIVPMAPHKVTREGKSIAVRFDAAALDLGQTTGQVADFVTAVRVQGTAVFIDLGAQAQSFSNEDDRDQIHLNVDLLPPPPRATPPAAAAAVPGQLQPLPDLSHLT